MTVAEFIVKHKGTAGAMAKARNMRFSGMVKAPCQGKRGTPHQVRALVEGTACFQCMECALALVSLLEVMAQQEKRGGPLSDDELRALRSLGEEPPATVDKYGLGTMSFRVPVKGKA